MLKRATSPEPSRSEKRLKQERPDSPGPSYLNVMKVEKSDSLYTQLLKQERSDSPAPSCTSKDLHDHFKQALLDSSDLTASLLTKDHFTCSVCTDVLKDPVSIPCGHSYCRQCITSYWAQPNHAGHYACPQCSHTYSSCPALYANSALAIVVQKLQHLTPAPPAHCYAGPGDVACDFCTGRKLRAVKSCLTCSASYCESHIRQHYTVPALQKHTLVEPEHQEEKPKDQNDFKTEDIELLDQQSFGLLSPDADQGIQQGTLDQRVKLERSDSAAASCVSLKSIDPPGHCKRELTPDSMFWKAQALQQAALLQQTQQQLQQSEQQIQQTQQQLQQMQQQLQQTQQKLQQSEQQLQQTQQKLQQMQQQLQQTQQKLQQMQQQTQEQQAQEQQAQKQQQLPQMWQLQLQQSQQQLQQTQQQLQQTQQQLQQTQQQLQQARQQVPHAQQQLQQAWPPVGHPHLRMQIQQQFNRMRQQELQQKLQQTEQQLWETQGQLWKMQFLQQQALQHHQAQAHQQAQQQHQVQVQQVPTVQAALAQNLPPHQPIESSRHL